MAKKQQDVSPLSGFDGVLGALTPNMQESNSVNMDDFQKEDNDDVADLSLANKGDDDVDLNDLDKIDDEKEEDLDLDFGSDEVDDEKDIKQNSNQDEDDDISEAETEQVSMFFDAFSESLGWDSDEENKPKTIEELIGYMQDIIETNSTADYASDEVKELDEYVRNGGSIQDYISVSSKVSSYDSLDLEDEDDQKTIVKDFLKRSGFNDKQIQRKIEKYEDAGLLEDEAEEALEFLKEATKKEKQEALKEQENQRLLAEEQQAKFYQEITSEIETLKEIRGIQVPQKDRKELMDYIFKVGPDGQTKYQKDYAANFKKNLLESAYFTMKGDSLIKSAKSTGETSAVQKFKQSLRTNKVGSSKHSMDNGSARPVWSAASSLIRGGK